METEQQSVMMACRSDTTMPVGVVPIRLTVPRSAAVVTLQETKLNGSCMVPHRFRFDMPRSVVSHRYGHLELAPVDDAFDRRCKGAAARQIVVLA